MRVVKRALRGGLNLVGYDVVKLPPAMTDGGSSPFLTAPNALFTAVEQGDSTRVASLIDSGFDPNARRTDGVTPLIVAAIDNRVEAIDTLLAKGADPNVASSEGWYAYHFAKNLNHAEAAARLLSAHDGRAPVYDYGAAFLKKAEPYQLAIYDALFAKPSVEQKRFFNIGSGNWRHPHWTNVDYASDYYDYDRSMIDVPWDISLLKPLDEQSSSVELAYCSHTTEHLTDEQNRFMFREVHRILKPGGVFRVTCPNIELYYQAYKRRDAFVKQHYGVPEALPSTTEMGAWFVNEIATQLVQQLDENTIGKLRGRLDEIDKVLDTLPLEAACDHFCSMIDYEIQRRFPGNHINWWTNDKMCRELRAAGFSEALVSLPGGCVTPAMRDRAYFDTVNPTFSLYVDAIK